MLVFVLKGNVCILLNVCVFITALTRQFYLQCVPGRNVKCSQHFLCLRSLHQKYVLGFTRHRVDVILKFSKPETIEELRRFLGIMNYYRHCIPNAAQCQAPLNNYFQHSGPYSRTAHNFMSAHNLNFRSF